jgi:hypothetical protein
MSGRRGLVVVVVVVVNDCATCAAWAGALFFHAKKNFGDLHSIFFRPKIARQGAWM